MATRGLTASAAAAQLDVSPSTVSRWRASSARIAETLDLAHEKARQYWHDKERELLENTDSDLVKQRIIERRLASRFGESPKQAVALEGSVAVNHSADAHPPVVAALLKVASSMVQTEKGKSSA